MKPSQAWIMGKSEKLKRLLTSQALTQKQFTSTSAPVIMLSHPPRWLITSPYLQTQSRETLALSIGKNSPQHGQASKTSKNYHNQTKGG